MTDISKLIRPNVMKLVPYSSARDEYTGSGALFLDANENPFNVPYNRYPDPHQVELKKKIGKLKKINDDQLFVGNGSDEAIDILFRIFCEPGLDNVVSIHPTYGMYRVCADINNIELRKVPLKQDFGLNLPSLKAACDEHTKLMFLCSPNNPTSNSFDPEEMLQLVDQLEVIVVVDEAYIDFSKRESLKNRVSTHPNLVVLQTFSKAWGLAGIRLGIAIGDPELIRFMDRVKYPYNVNMLTQKLAIEVLNEEEKVKQWIEAILSERAVLERELARFRFIEHIYPSDANFLLVKANEPKKIYNYLVERHIIIRDRSNVALCEGCLRITVGTREENLQLTEALGQYQQPESK
ncbi:MAG: histidinol-phosphate transaminase [Bacteroidales bacterium]